MKNIPLVYLSSLSLSLLIVYSPSVIGDVDFHYCKMCEPQPLSGDVDSTLWKQQT